jgi:hypothetical protein
MSLILQDCGGWFRLKGRVDTQDWHKVKAFFSYYDEEWLEDMDVFDLEAGWYTGLDQVPKIEAILGIPEQDRYAVRSQREKVEAAAAVIKQAREKFDYTVTRAIKGRYYEEWQTRVLDGLIMTSAPLPIESAEWQHLVSFDSDTPGTWTTTGDSWYRSEKDGQTVYRRDYGNACQYFAPPGLVDEACRMRWQEWVTSFGEVDAARYFLIDYDRVREPGMVGCYGDDVARRYVELEGLDKLVQLAGREEWVIGPHNAPNSIVQAAARYGLSVTVLESAEPWSAKLLELKVTVRGETRGVQALLKHPDGRIFAQTYHGNLVDLAKEPARPN